MKKVTIITAFFLCIAGALFAGVFEDKGLTVLSQQRRADQTIWIVEHRNGAKAEVVTLGEPDRREADIVSNVLSIFPSWEYLKVKSIRVELMEERAQVLVVPESFEYMGVDLAQYMPSGMQFYYEKFAEYDFRILVDGLFLRIQGQLFNEEQLCEKVKSAVDNPAAYVQSHDPEYVIVKFKEIDGEIDTLTAADRETGEEISALRSDMEEEIALLKEELASLSAAYTSLEEELRKTRYAIMVFHNTGFLRGPTVIGEEGIERVLELKKERPDITKKEVEEILKSENIKMSGQEIELVFKVYYNIFKF